MSFSCLVAGYIKKLIKESNVNLKVGLVQTAYANGSSTEYINNTLVINVSPSFVCLLI